MGRGFLEAYFYVGNYILPVENVKVLVKDKRGNIIRELVSDKYGKIEKISLDAPDISSPDIIVPEFATYDVEIPYANRYKKVVIHGVEIFDKITTMLPIQMHPAIRNYPPEKNIDVYNAPSERTVAECRTRAGGAVLENPGVAEMTERILANEVAIPEYITVHLGYANDDTAENYRLPFIDYVKNVASREVFPTWTEATLTANILAQMSFALNRIYTVWYPSRGKSYDITNKTDRDQAFEKNKQPFPVMSAIVDKIFTSFIRRQGRRDPFFAEYCNGTSSTCPGMYQCESQELGLAGWTYLQILQHYYPTRNAYPNDIQIVESNNFASGVGHYPGSTLSIGSSGDDVLRMQIYLNRLSGNWYVTPIPIQNLNGVFGVDTQRAVIMFQENTPFGLINDGKIGKTTWNAITLAYTAATELGELTSEGERLSIGAAPPTSTLQITPVPNETRGEDVAELQFLLNFIAQFFETVPFVIQNGVYRENTKRGVIEFQKTFGLPTDGIVRPSTWQVLYDVYYDIQGAVPPQPPVEPPVEPPTTPPNPSIPPFPGYILKTGSSGSDVLLMQNYLNAIAQIYASIPTLVPDGSFGPATYAAVAAFQRQFGLTADGQIGPITWYKIIDVYNNLTIIDMPQFPGTILRIGSRGDDVLLMQQYLRAISAVFTVIPALTADGIFGTGTATSVRAFQSFFGLTVDGEIGKITWDKIVYIYNSMPAVASPQYPGFALRVGSRGNDVIIMQKYLNVIAGQHSSIPAPGTADGIFGPGTEASVKAFQRQFGLTADGEIGRITWNQIVSVYNQILMNTALVGDFATRSVNVGSNSVDKYAMLLSLGLFQRY